MKMFELEYERIEKGLCATCGGDIKEFRDELSEKEFKISRMCQTCQDDVFGCGDE